MSAALRKIHRALNRPLGRYWVTERFEPAFVDGPSLAWVRMNLDAFGRFRAMYPRRFTHVGMFSFSRAGSHLFESQFHFVKSCFCFGEAHVDFRTDLNWRTFLCRGMYRTDSVQDKSGRDVTHLFYNCNKSSKYLDHPQWALDDLDYRRKWILVMRNPLRVLMSRQATKKRKWQWSEASVPEFFDWFDKARGTFTNLIARRPDDVMVVSIEQFVADPTHVLDAMSDLIGLDRALVRSRPSARQFFRQIGRTGEKAILRDGYLASPSRDIAIKGWGGDFNPLLDIDADRLYRHDIASTIPPEVLRLARTHLGERAYEFYMNDRDHRFAGVQAADLLQL